MEIKDLGELSEPMKKLIEVVAQGIGGWAKPWQIKRLANAKAYEIETVTRALRNNSEDINLLEYDGEKVKLLCERGVSPEAAQELIALNERTVSRLTHREIRRQLNIEKAVHYAMDELLQAEHVSAEPVDEDWIARFFNIAEDVSNEQMQQLWGRILAGEIKRPKSFSLRTLETLRNISPEEATVFCKVCNYTLLSKEHAFIPIDRECELGEFGITYEDILLLRDAGLLSQGDMQFSFNMNEKDNVSYLIYGNTVLIATRKDATPVISFKVVKFTGEAREMLDLTTKVFDKRYVSYIGNKLKINNSVIVSYANIVSVKEEGIYYSGLIELD